MWHFKDQIDSVLDTTDQKKILQFNNQKIPSGSRKVRSLFSFNRKWKFCFWLWDQFYFPLAGYRFTRGLYDIRRIGMLWTMQRTVQLLVRFTSAVNNDVCFSFLTVYERLFTKHLVVPVLVTNVQETSVNGPSVQIRQRHQRGHLLRYQRTWKIGIFCKSSDHVISFLFLFSSGWVLHLIPFISEKTTEWSIQFQQNKEYIRRPRLLPMKHP